MVRSLILLLGLAGLSCKAQRPDTRFLYSVSGTESAYPVLSREGEKVLFQTNAAGKWQLAFLDVDTKAVTPLTRDGFNNNFPHWSYDNAWVAFVSDRDGNEEIYRMRPDGTDLQRVTDHASRDIHPYFSPDGRYILFNSDREGSLDVYRYEIATGKTDRIIESGMEETCAKYLPDMKRIVYLANNAAVDDIFLLDPAKPDLVNITRTPAVRDGWPACSPDGKWIYYSSFVDKAFHLFRCRPDGSGREQITVAKPGEEDARVAISPDGRRLVYNKRTGGTIEIWIADLR